jgi:hypothetical protein
VVRWLGAGALVLALGACGGDDDDSGADVPASPSGLEGAVMGEGIHLTWVDESQDETEFVIERKDGDGDFAELMRVPFDTTQHHDAPLETDSYSYRIAAVNDAGSSPYTQEITVEMP